VIFAQDVLYREADASIVGDGRHRQRLFRRAIFGG